VSASPGWYPDPGGGQGLFRYWDGRAWSAAVSPHPSAPPPAQGLVGGGTAPQGDNPSGQGGQPAYGQSPYGQDYDSGAYANYQELQKKKSPLGWWIAGGALVIVIVVIAVLAVRAVTDGDTGTTGGPAGQPSQDVCPPQITASPEPGNQPADGRVHGGPVSYPVLGPPWGSPQGDTRVPFGSDVQSQDVAVEYDYDGNGSLWVASIIVGELQAGDGFFTPEQGAQIVVRCIVGGSGEFYGDNPVNSNVKVNEKTTIDGHEAWLVESHLTFDIAGLKTKGELLIVAIVSAGNRSGLYYASIPDTTPELVQPARDALRDLKVDS
jgi:Protein of unknown function (DUF2510)